jgi:predicted peptidase
MRGFSREKASGSPFFFLKPTKGESEGRVRHCNIDHRSRHLAAMQRICLLAGAIAAAVAPVFAAPATAPSVSTRATTGCGKTHLFPGITTYHGLESSGRDRTYSVHLPTTYDKSKPYPLVIGFHGSSSIGLFFEVDTKLSDSRFSANVGF